MPSTRKRLPSAKDVADAYGIPAQLLAKILQLLTKHGMLRSHAGMNGGYALARDAREISAYEVIHAIDGPFFITSCTKGESPATDAELHHQRAAGAGKRDHCRSSEEHQHSGPGGTRTAGGTATREQRTGFLDVVER